MCSGVGEALLRAAPRRNDAVLRHGELKYRFNPYQPDAELGWVHRPNWETVHQTDEFRVTVRTGALGLRGGPSDLTKPPGTYRILVLGDSFAFGWGVEYEQSFAARLERELAPPPGKLRVQVLDAGVAGWSADHYLIHLRTRGLALDPDLVLVAPSQNDLSDLAWNRLTLDADRLPIRTSSTLRMIDRTGRMRYLDSSPLALPSLSFPGQVWLAEHSALYNSLRFRLARTWLGWTKQRVEAMRERDYGTAPEGPIASLSDDAIQRGLLGDRHFQLRYHEYLMAAIRRAAGARGIPVHTLVIVNRGEAAEPGSTMGQLRADCARDPTCTWSPDLLGGVPEGDRFFHVDGHWTAASHAAAGSALARILAR